jgi:hypothetical protein
MTAVGATAPSTTRVDAAADDGDVHLGARDEAQIGVALMRLRLRDVELDEELALAERGAARPGRDRLDRHFAAAAAGTGDDDGGAGGDHRRYAVGRRRGVAQIAGKRGAALDLGRADQVGTFDDAGIGMLQPLVIADHHSRGRGADDKAVGLLADADQPGDALGVDDQVGTQATRAQLDQQIGAAGQDLRHPRGAGQDGYGFVDRLRRRKTEPGHVCSCAIALARPPSPDRSGRCLFLAYTTIQGGVKC